MANIDETLNARLKTYGEFKDHAYIAQALKDVMHNAPKWGELSADKKEALEMVQHKIARILNGDPEYQDNWHDVIGYSRLIEIDLEARSHIVKVLTEQMAVLSNQRSV
ncbi:MAG TPA: DUF6378 domain-containing protein [Mucilaginibacter sp.]|jgi:hypothetical protein